MTPQASDSSLARRVRGGDRQAVGEIYDRYASVAMATALRVTRDRQVAEDVVHDAFVTMWRRIDSFDPARGNLRSWLLTIVRNRAIDKVRARRPSMDLQQADELALLRSEMTVTQDAAAGRIAAGDLRHAIEQLPSEQRRAIDLAYFEGHTYREIAAMTGVPAGTASGRLRLALRKLRQALALSEADPGEPPAGYEHGSVTGS